MTRSRIAIALQRPTQQMLAFARFLARRFNDDQCFEAAGALSFTTVFALVPLLTVTISVLAGSLLLTFVYAVLEGTAAAPEWRAFLGIGLLGGYTTFSTFSYETVRLIQDGDWSRAGLYVGVSVFASLGAAIIGFNLGLSFLRRG